MARPIASPAVIPAKSTRLQRQSYATVLSVFILLLIVALTTSWVAIEIINNTRAYGTGEGRYSKAEKMAVLYLHRFAYSHDEQDYAGFLDIIGVPRGDRKARLALSQTPPDLDAAAQGFLEGQNHPDDIPGMIRLFRGFSWWTPFAAAVEDWRIGDGLVNDLIEQGAQLHQLAGADQLSAGQRAALLSRIDAIDALLTDRENTFSNHMGEAARSAKALVILGLGGTTILLWAIGIALATRLFRQQSVLDAQLASSEERFRDYAEVASDWYWETDPNNRITYVSERFHQFTKMSPGDVLGLDGIAFFRQHSDSGEHRDDCLLAMSERRPFRGLQQHAVLADGTRSYWSISGKPCVDAKGDYQGYRGVGTDVTSQVEDGLALTEAKDRAEVANRAKSEFLANMSHELRTPLNAILGFSEIIKLQAFGRASIDRYANYAGDIHRSGSHLLAIINDLLDLSKIEAGRMTLSEKEIGFDTIVERLHMLLADFIRPQKVKFTIAVPSPSPRLSVDDQKFVQILVNLLSNAFKFTPEGGAITLSVGVQSDGRLAVIVCDTGIGIAKSDMETVLSPFGQVESAFKREHHGTGLGLPLTNCLVQMHGGTMAIESEEGEGTTVTVFLPASRVLASSAQPAKLLAG